MPTLRTKILCAAKVLTLAEDPQSFQLTARAQQSPPQPCLSWHLLAFSDDWQFWWLVSRGGKLTDGMLLKLINYYNVGRKGFTLSPGRVHFLSSGGHCRDLNHSSGKLMLWQTSLRSGDCIFRRWQSTHRWGYRCPDSPGLLCHLLSPSYASTMEKNNGKTMLGKNNEFQV